MLFLLLGACGPDEDPEQNAAPEVEILSPSDGDVLSTEEVVTLTFVVSDDGPLSDVVVNAWASDAGEGSTQDYAFARATLDSSGEARLECEGLPEGEVYLLVKAVDDELREGQAEVAVTLRDDDDQGEDEG